MVIVSIIKKCLCCRKSLKVYAAKETQTTETQVEIDVYTDDFESSTSPVPSPNKKDRKISLPFKEES